MSRGKSPAVMLRHILRLAQAAPVRLSDSIAKVEMQRTHTKVHLNNGTILNVTAWIEEPTDESEARSVL